MITRIITPVGISIFENNKHLYGTFKKELRNPEQFYVGAGASARFQALQGRSDELLRRLESFLAYDFNGAAEINSLKRIIEDLPSQEGERHTVELYLLASDTVFSVLAALWIKKWLQQDRVKDAHPDKEISVHFPNVCSDDNGALPLESEYDSFIIKDLRVGEQKTYYRGFGNLIEAIGAILVERIEYKVRFKACIFNITSGYKAITPIISTLAQLTKNPLR